MQNMVVLIDTNILLNYLTNRDDDYLKQSIRIVEMCAKGECIADYIITCNTKDFENSEIPAVNPIEFLKLLKTVEGY